MSIQKLTIGELLYQVENLRSKNRDLLSIEDVRILDECVKTLKELKKRKTIERSEEVLTQWMKVVVHLFRFFSETDMF